MSMQITPILVDWNSWLNRKPKEVLLNCTHILELLRGKYGPGASIVVVGRGYSGAQLISAVSMVNQFHDRYNLQFDTIIIPKGEERSSSTNHVFSPYSPVVVLDDDIMTGRTMKAIHDWLAAMQPFDRLIDKIEVVVGRCRYKWQVETNSKIITDNFPNTNLWIR